MKARLRRAAYAALNFLEASLADGPSESPGYPGMTWADIDEAKAALTAMDRKVVLVLTAAEARALNRVALNGCHDYLRGRPSEHRACGSALGKLQAVVPRGGSPR